MSNYKLRMSFWNDENALFNGQTFEALLAEDMLDILASFKSGECTVTDMIGSLCLHGRTMQSYVQKDKGHRWIYNPGRHACIESIAEDLGFTIEHRTSPRRGAYITL